MGGGTLIYPCADADHEVYDCGNDDYFNPSPAGGSYLATHWNVYDGAFMAPCGQIPPACGGGMEGLVPAPPVATSPPQVAGVPRRGRTVDAVAGGWQNGPLTYRYRWQRQGRNGRWANIAGATAASYRPTKTDRGKRLRIQVVATNPDGSASAASPPSGRVADGKVGHAQEFTSRRFRAAKGRARRPAARCRGHRTSKRAHRRSR